MSLTVQELEEKIARAKKDLALAEGGRKTEILSEYIEMLEEELYNAKCNNTET
jgi:hypothetical protein